MDTLSDPTIIRAFLNAYVTSHGRHSALARLYVKASWDPVRQGDVGMGGEQQGSRGIDGLVVVKVDMIVHPFPQILPDVIRRHSSIVVFIGTHLGDQRPQFIEGQTVHQLLALLGQREQVGRQGGADIVESRHPRRD